MRALPETAKPLLLCLVIAAAGSVHGFAQLAATLGDTDDAMRLGQAHALLGGRGWFDPIEPRLAPPAGLYVHWSRLVDAPIAALLGTLEALFGPQTGALAARAVWPLLLFAPAAWLWIRSSQKLGGPAAAWAAAALAPLCWLLWAQFAPGRLDHHNVQLLLMAAMMAASLALPAPRAAALLGGACALSLAVGFEALPAIVWAGGLIGVRLILDVGNARATTAFGLAFAGVAAGGFLLQTPPAFWGRAACDAMAVNGLAGAVAAGLGLAAAGRWAHADWRWRLAALAAAGGLAAGVFLALHPACLGGPYAELDPRLQTIWLDRVGEARTLWTALKGQPLMALSMAGLPLATLAASAWAIWRGKRDPGFAGLAALLGLTCLVGLAQTRGFTFATATAIPLAASLLAGLPRVARLRPLLAGVALGFAASPTAALFALTAVTPAAVLAREEKAVRDQAPCFTFAAFADLKRLPPGLVLADLDAGPFILAETAHAAVAAPYHRLNQPIYDAMTVFYGSPEAAAETVARTGADYVALCKTGVFASEAKPGAFGFALKHGPPPAWARPLPSAPGGYFLYRVDKAALARG